jgi:hypothetical protein
VYTTRVQQLYDMLLSKSTLHTLILSDKHASLTTSDEQLQLVENIRMFVLDCCGSMDMFVNNVSWGWRQFLGSCVCVCV